MLQQPERNRSGGQILVDQLLVHGAEIAFCVPGESYLEVLDALHDVRDKITLINARHEAGAANMAEAYGKLTGRPGICLVTRGPGACHAAVGVHTAFQDSTPMILLVGQVGRDATDREAFQEIDYRQMFGSVAKWVAQIEQTERIPEYLARAYHLATSGRPGPVVLALPEDMLKERAAVNDAARYTTVQPRMAGSELGALRDLLVKAERPLLLVGGSGWPDEACAQILRFAEASQLPVACSFRRQDVFDNRSSCFVGDFGTSGPPSLIRRAKEADLIVVVGARLGEMTTQGYSLVNAPVPVQRLVHIHPSADEIGRVYAPHLAIAASTQSFAALAAHMEPVASARWHSWRETLRREFEEAINPPKYDGALDIAQVLAELRDELPEDVIITLDAGNHTGWPQRYLTYRRPSRQIGPTSGAMGYSVPAAVAASLIYPDRLVIGCVGDGGFMMSGQEIQTAVQHGGKPIIVVFNNEMYGTIRMHQEREHPGRVVGTDLINPDFVAFAAAMGAHAERVECSADFHPALKRARASGRAAVIELRADPEQVSTRATLAQLRRAARKHLESEKA
ncbi:MAG TPA: thiamine pyrophosphate-binding protein [Bradyrhizobium sp.]|nr:thiamine pyrophosphate-binding protein [Bradyrhizobium sp.]